IRRDRGRKGRFGSHVPRVRASEPGRVVRLPAQASRLRRRDRACARGHATDVADAEVRAPLPALPRRHRPRRRHACRRHRQEHDGRPPPQPERREPKLADPGLRDLSFADYKAIVIRAAKEFMNDNAMLLAQALAYSAFFAIPSVLLVVVGLFTLVAGPSTIASLMGHLNHVMPAQATTLLNQSLTNLDKHPASSIVMTTVGFVLALWATTSA